MDQLGDLIGLHCTSGSVQNNGVVLPLFFIRLMIIQYRCAPHLVGPGHPQECASDVTRLFLPSFYLFFKACFQYVAYSFEEYVFVLKCACMCASVSACEKEEKKSHWYRTNCQNKSCSIQNRLSCQGHIFLLPISWQTLSQQLSVVFSVLVSRAPPQAILKL